MFYFYESRSHHLLPAEHIFKLKTIGVSMLELKNVEKSYHGRSIIQIPTLRLQPGIYWIKGANGSGKTTVLKMMAGLSPFGGEISYDGISQKSEPVAYRKCIGWAEAEPVYPPFLSGLELIGLYQNVRRSPRNEIDELLSLFDMTKYISDATGTYSAGMIKKLSLVLAFLGHPPLCLLDEPLITLDAAAFDSVCSLILERCGKGATFLMSSHQDLSTPLMLAGKELLIDNKSISFPE